MISLHAHAARFDLKYVDDLVTVVASERAVTVRGTFPGMTVEQGWQLSFTGDRPGPLVKAELAITEA